MTARTRKTVLFIALVLSLLGIAGSAAFSQAGPEQMRRIAALLRQADQDGLDPAAYEAADAQAFSAWAGDLALGRAGLRTLDRDVVLPAPDFDPRAVVEQALREDRLRELPARLMPPHADYARLKTALARYRAIAAAGGWPQLPGAARDYTQPKPLTLLWRRLAFEDETIAGAPQPALAAALIRFQRLHGLEADGILGPATLRALNVPAEARVETILANMERWRWLPRRLEPDRIMINAASAELSLILKDQEVLRSRVVVGRPRDRTPILRAEAAGLTVNPPWNVPVSIAAREILPKLKRDPGYLASQDMVLLNGPPGDPHGRTVDWQAIPAGTFPYRVRQHPGPGNALGQVKIELPNRFDVYLHDTPARTAFARQDRHLSHGCVRVEKILPLASLALSADLAAMEKIVAAIDTGGTAYMPLEKKLPVYFLYWTAVAGGDGTVAFWPDAYGRDTRLLAALRKKALLAADISDACRKA